LSTAHLVPVSECVAELHIVGLLLENNSANEYAVRKKALGRWRPRNRQITGVARFRGSTMIRRVRDTSDTGYDLSESDLVRQHAGAELHLRCHNGKVPLTRKSWQPPLDVPHSDRFMTNYCLQSHQTEIPENPTTQTTWRRCSQDRLEPSLPYACTRNPMDLSVRQATIWPDTSVSTAC